MEDDVTSFLVHLLVQGLPDFEEQVTVLDPVVEATKSKLMAKDSF